MDMNKPPERPILKVPPKRPRKAHFTDEERICLIDLVAKYKQFIGNKKFTRVVLRKKQACWKKIEAEFSAITGTFRPRQSLEVLWKNMKQKVRDFKAAEARLTEETGQAPIVEYDEEFEKIYKIISCSPDDSVENGTVNESDDIIEAPGDFEDNIEKQNKTEGQEDNVLRSLLSQPTDSSDPWTHRVTPTPVVVELKLDQENMYMKKTRGDSDSEHGDDLLQNNRSREAKTKQEQLIEEKLKLTRLSIKLTEKELELMSEKAQILKIEREIKLVELRAARKRLYEKD